MGLRFDPMGGGQFKEAVKQIVEAERMPIKNMEQRKSREEARMKLFQDFKNKFTGMDKTLQEFADFRKFRELKADLGDASSLVGVTIDKERAETGSYVLQLDQLAARSSVISNGFENPDEICLGIGFVVGERADGEVSEIFIDEEHASLRGVASQINADPELAFRASVIQDKANPEQPWRLIISSKKDGNDNFMVFPEFYFLDGTEDFYIAGDHEAQNALLQIDGFEIEADTNLVKEFLQGINLHLKQAKPDEPFTLNITQDYQKIAGKMKALVDQVNGILDFINKQNQIDEKSDTKSTFAGDTSLQTIEYRLRNLLHEGFPVGDPDEDGFHFKFINQMGVEFDKSGHLEFKEEKFTKVLESDFDGVSEAITGPYGFANQLRTVVGAYTRPSDGLLAIKEGGLRSRIRRIDDDIARKERMVNQKQESLVRQFSKLQASLAAMQQQQQYLSAALPGGAGGNMVQALLGG